MNEHPLQLIKTRYELAEYLKVSEKSLIWYLYRLDVNKRYTRFEIPKKNGDSRIINAPATYLRRVQKNLSDSLYDIYLPYANTHGFVQGKNILTNAKAHPESKWVLNLDIKDFFPAINFGRVFGLFKKPPLSCDPEVAMILAQIACHENQLPQGSPSSPVISNFICRRLDRELKKYAERYRCRYTRYADDITISTKYRNFPKFIAELSDDPTAVFAVKLSREIVHIIKNNGFEINQDKTRLRNYTQRLEVTGLTINEKPNTTRAYVRQIRAMLHAWEKFGLEDAEKTFNQEYRKKLGNPKIEECVFRNVVHGKLNFLRMIRGVEDPLYRKLRYQFESLDPKFKGIRSHNLKARLYQSTWCVMSKNEMSQGTGFWLKDVGFVTCAHVLGEIDNYYVFNIIDQDSKKYPVEIIKIDKEKDIAILKIIGAQPEFELSVSSKEIEHQDEITIAGFPGYIKENLHTIYIATGRATQKLSEPISHNIMWRIDAQISSGNSGGPVLNSKYRVVGIVARGSHDMSVGNSTPLFGILPINSILELSKNP